MATHDAAGIVRQYVPWRECLALYDVAGVFGIVWCGAMMWRGLFVSRPYRDPQHPHDRHCGGERVDLRKHPYYRAE